MTNEYTSLFDEAQAKLSQAIAEFEPPEVHPGQMVFIVRQPNDMNPALGIVLEHKGRAIAVHELNRFHSGSVLRDNCFHRSDPRWLDPNMQQATDPDSTRMWFHMADRGVGSKVSSDDMDIVNEVLKENQERIEALEARMKDAEAKVNKRGPGRPRGS